MPITYAFLSGNPRKCAEYSAQMAKYGRAVRILPFADSTDEQMAEIERYLRGADEKDRYALRETSDLYVADDWDNGVETVTDKTKDGERVYHVSRLDVYTLDAGGKVQKKRYQAAVEGHINLAAGLTTCNEEHGIVWWDDIFVTDRSTASYNQERELWGKSSARQQAIGRFICDHVLFKRLRDVTYNPHNPSEAVDFTANRSAGAVLRNNAFVGMARLQESPWRLGNLLTHIINNGAFFRSADSARSGNYFCPPISGIPRHKKPDPFWETTYQIHDYFHQAIADQLFCGNGSTEHRNVQVAARLMSEGFTIVLADMLFIEAIKASGFAYDFSTRKINPLFNSLILPEGTPTQQLKALLRANVLFANLGDESGYKDMLKPGCDNALGAYTNTYKHFFVPDLIWSAGNYDDMASRRDTFSAWRELVGLPLFARARLPLLDDLVADLKSAGADLSTYESSVMPVFENLFEKVLAPQLEDVEPVDDEQAQSNAFRRYMIGQAFVYATYRHVAGMPARGSAMVERLASTELFTASLIADIRKQYRSDLEFLHDRALITHDDLLLYRQIFPIFSARYLSYNFDQAQFASIPEAIPAVFGRIQA